ncbi:hypothetical protein [Natronorubrum texcoconense]|uniref:Uncharacterized protein n=1 Tax=Natronorubrum texcoconense TaxID=1095776 RepID=A0A1G8XN20_9EURY|nr:hypothetical protein [Natronorubrum texcoconense]SDJ91170.1 hypothetical protein SAMN04515672_1802 [Natronorubrum texcoconense]
MVNEHPDREPIVSEGRYAVVADDDADAEYRLVVEGHEGGLPLPERELDDLETVVSRFRNARHDSGGTEPETPDSVELNCHECGKTWTYTGSEEHAACPNCETEVPVEGIGP